MENQRSNDEISKLEQRLQSALDEISSLRHERDGFASQLRKFIPCATPEEEAAFRFELETALPGGLMDIVEVINNENASPR